MEAIRKDFSGKVEVDFNQENLSADEMDVLVSALLRFDHYIPLGEDMSFFELTQIVSRYEMLEQKTQVMLDVLEKAGIQYEFSCRIKYHNPKSGVLEQVSMVVRCESAKQVSMLLPDYISESMVNIELLGAKSVYRKGCLSYESSYGQQSLTG